MDTKSAGILGGCIVAAAVALGLSQRSPAGAGPAMHVHSAAGNLKVDYSVQTSPTAAEGSTIAGVSDIEFYPGYVVVRTRQGGGMVFYNDRTRSLTWSLTSSTPKEGKD